MSDEEIAEKLAQLKQYSREFDAHEARWKATGGERVAYQAMMEAEAKYNALSDWFTQQRIHIFWDRQRQKYIALPSIHAQ